MRAKAANLFEPVHKHATPARARTNLPTRTRRLQHSADVRIAARTETQNEVLHAENAQLRVTNAGLKGTNTTMGSAMLAPPRLHAQM